jgi:pSer/pThr/pTyr-binding forkhead associated (FHA) protein
MTPGPAPEAPARLVVSLPGGGKQAFTLSKAVVTIGRGMTSDIVLRDAMVSRRHARLERTTRGYEVIDLESANGVRINGVPETRATLVTGDVLTFGECTLRFEAEPAGGEPEITRFESDQEFETVMLESPVAIALEESDAPRLAVHTTERTWEVPLAGDHLTVGRDPANDLVLDHRSVSRHHAVIERAADEFVLRDLDSRNGTWIGAARVSRAVLADGDSVKIGPARLVLKRGVSPDELAEAPADELGAGTRRPVVVIPGFAGSNLFLGGEQVWPTLRMRGLADALSLEHRLEARGIVDGVVVVPNLIRLDQYGVLTGYLKEHLGYETGRDLLEFAYDFRQDNRASARQLAAQIDAWSINEPITIIAHSMGCLIARYYVERLGGGRKVERVLLLGGPHAGSPYAFASLISGPDLLPLGMMNQRLRDIIATFPSWYQILPTYRCVSCGSSTLDVLADETWVAESHRPLLRGARQFRRELGRQASVPTVCVFGYGVKTITAVTVERDATGALTGADAVTEDIGDGTIPQTSAVLRGAEIHPVRQHHGSLYVDNDVKMRIKLELTRPR